jgi:hypothetical protein
MKSGNHKLKFQLGVFKKEGSDYIRHGDNSEFKSFTLNKPKPTNNNNHRNPCDNFDYDVVSSKIDRDYGNAKSYAIYIQCRNHGGHAYIFKYQDFNNGHVEYTKSNSGYNYGSEYQAAKSACGCN